MKLERVMEYSGRIQSPVAEVGVGPLGHRQIYAVVYGSFEGPRLKGNLLPGSADAALSNADGTMWLDLRSTFEPDDGAYIYCQGNGVWRSDPAQPDKSEGEPAEYGDMYIMSTQQFETGGERYKWLNDMVFVAEGKMDPVFEDGYMADISWQVYSVVND